VASLIIGDPELSRPWILKWRELPRATMRTAGDCLFEREDITDRLSEISCPAIVFHGTADLSIEMNLADALCEGLSGCVGVVRVEGATHVSNLTHPDEVNLALLDFLRSL
jgi:3-oxoadipate enol-lactonase